MMNFSPSGKSNKEKYFEAYSSISSNPLLRSCDTTNLTIAIVHVIDLYLSF